MRRDGSVANKQLKELGPDVMSRVDQKLLSGDSGLIVARWLQNDCGVMTDVALPTLKKQVERYRGGELRHVTLSRIAGAQANTPVKSIIKRLNALDSLEEMTTIQRARVDKLLMHESTLPPGILMKSASDELKLLKEYLVELGKAQLETGVLARASRTVKGQVVDEHGQVKQFVWTEEQEELFKELEGRSEYAADDA